VHLPIINLRRIEVAKQYPASKGNRKPFSGPIYDDEIATPQGPDIRDTSSKVIKSFEKKEEPTEVTEDTVEEQKEEQVFETKQEPADVGSDTEDYSDMEESFALDPLFYTEPPIGSYYEHVVIAKSPMCPPPGLIDRGIGRRSRYTEWVNENEEVFVEALATVWATSVYEKNYNVYLDLTGIKHQLVGDIILDFKRVHKEAIKTKAKTLWKAMKKNS
jgi:hypothetical protein